jgi:transcriptional regulator with XRE-family HTH domain
MHGAGDNLGVGERIAFYRQRRGFTQAVLAGLVGRSEDWLSKIERGERQAQRLDVVTDLARELGVSLGDLIGQPVLTADDGNAGELAAVRDVLMAPWRLSRLLSRTQSDGDASPPIAWSEQHVEAAWRDHQAGRVSKIISSLPQLVELAQQLEDGASSGERRRRSWAVSARVHHLATTTLINVGATDLAWVAAERAMHAADQSDDPLALASAARACTHTLLATGRYADALEVGTTAARWLRAHIADRDPVALSLLGMLHLRAAIAAARAGDRGAANDLLRQATEAAERLGRDANYWQTSFGPTNVELHRLSAALDLGDIRYVVEHAAIDASGLPVERRAVHLVEMARALVLARENDQALQLLLTAEQYAPTLVHQSASVRATVRTLRRRAPVSGGVRSSALLALAQRCRAVA